MILLRPNASRRHSNRLRRKALRFARGHFEVPISFGLSCAPRRHIEPKETSQLSARNSIVDSLAVAQLAAAAAIAGGGQHANQARQSNARLPISVSLAFELFERRKVARGGREAISLSARGESPRRATLCAAAAAAHLSGGLSASACGPVAVRYLLRPLYGLVTRAQRPIIVKYGPL